MFYEDLIPEVLHLQHDKLLKSQHIEYHSPHFELANTDRFLPDGQNIAHQSHLVGGKFLI